MVRRFRQWLYAGKRPNWIARIANRTAAAIASSGLGANVLVTLEVAGRKSGKTVTLPLVMAVIGGQRYLVSMLGDDVQWVLNVRAAGGKAAIREGALEQVQLDEIPVAQRAPVLKEYLKRAPGARPHMPVTIDSPIEDFEKIAAGYPVFRVTPRTG
jgi:hypothetical protein